MCWNRHLWVLSQMRKICSEIQVCSHTWNNHILSSLVHFSQTFCFRRCGSQGPGDGWEWVNGLLDHQRPLWTRRKLFCSPDSNRGFVTALTAKLRTLSSWVLKPVQITEALVAHSHQLSLLLKNWPKLIPPSRWCATYTTLSSILWSEHMARRPRKQNGYLNWRNRRCT